MCFTLRLHMSAAPSQGGLTPALGGEKRFVIVFFAAVAHRLRLALLFGQAVGALPLHPSLHDALTHRMRYVQRLRNLRFLSFGFVASDAVASEASG